MKKLVIDWQNMKRILTLIFLVFLSRCAIAEQTGPSEAASPLTDTERSELNRVLQRSLEDASDVVQAKPDGIDGYSRRGDAYFFLGQFPQAVADYDKMVELDESLGSSHWRRGIAFFYAERYEDASAQFEKYHSFDQIDRENGIWRFLSQHRAHGQDTARKGLLKYQKDDREPFPSVYKLFAGTVTGDQILQQVEMADVKRDEREKRLFYAHLYIGLNDAVLGNDSSAQEHLALATKNRWARGAGYGPNYMWHVGRLHEELLRRKSK